MKTLLACALLCGLVGSVELAGAVDVPGSEAGRRARDDAARRSVAQGLQGDPLTGEGPATMSGYAAFPRFIQRPGSTGLASGAPAVVRPDRQPLASSPVSGAFPF